MNQAPTTQITNNINCETQFKKRKSIIKISLVPAMKSDSIYLVFTPY